MSDDAATALVHAVIAVDVAVVAARVLLRGSAVRRLSASGWRYVWLLYVVAFGVMWSHPFPVPTPPWYDATVRPLGLLLLTASTAVLVWAYAAMGRYWDGDISARADHRVVQRGPFALVRHPVYLSFDLAVVGAALALADPLVGLVAILSLPLMYGRARAEERFLVEQLGDAYRDYRRRVPMFLPWPRPR